MDRSLSKFLFITSLSEYLVKKYHLSYDECLDRLYTSELMPLIDDDELYLTGDSPIYVWSEYEKRQKEQGRIVF